MVIIVGIRIRLFFVSSLMIVHFDRNPVSSRSHPSDKSEISNIRVITGVMFQEWAKDSVLVFEL
jgi:hypothetical protein